MPILLARAKPPYKTDEGEPGLWRQGEIVQAFADDHTFGSQEVISAGNFWHIKVTDKTLAEVQSYLQSWNHDPDVQQIAATGDDRTIQVTSTMVSASGGNQFEAAKVDELLGEINAEYPTANALRTGLTTTTFTFTITAPVAARDEIIERINQAVRDWSYRRRRWYINAAGRTYLEANGGYVEGTAAQVGNYLRDGLLD